MTSGVGVVLVDAGNTSLRFAVARAGAIRPVWRGPLASLDARGVHPAERALSRLRGIGGASVAAGRADSAEAIARILRRAGTIPRIHFVAHDGSLPFRIRYARGSRAGPDRIANIAALRHLVGPGAFAISAGTATTIDVLGPTGDFEGGAILPGVATALSALSAATAGRLPAPPPRVPQAALGRSTRECLLSGGVLGHVLAIEGLIRSMIDEEPDLAEAPVHLTGGAAKAIAPAFAIPVIHEPNLTLIGLRELWREAHKTD